MPVNLHSQCMYFGRHTCNLEIIVHVLQESLAQAPCSTSLVAGRDLESVAVQIWARAQQAQRLVLGNEGAQRRCTPDGPADLSMRRALCLDLCPWLGICLFLHMVLMTAGCWLCTGPAAWAAVLECWVLLLGVRNLERTQLVQEELVILGANQLEYHYGKAMQFIFVGVCQVRWAL